MNVPRPASRLLFSALAGLAFLIGCESSSGPAEAPPASTAVLAKGSLELSGSAILPDSGVWRTSKSSRRDSGRGRIGCTRTLDNSNVCTQTFDLDAPLGLDLLVQDLYSLGIRYATVKYSQSGSQENLNLLKDSTRIYSVEESLIRGFRSAWALKHPDGVSPTSSDLLAYYAGLLLKADSTVLAKSLPAGVEIDSVRKALVLVASQQGVPAEILASKELLGLSSDSIHALMVILVKEARITDTTRLYPKFVVGVTEDVKVVSDLVVGEGKQRVTGTFVWSAGKSVRRIEIEIRSAQGTEDSIIARFEKSLDTASGRLVLDSNLTLQARPGARVGWDTLVVRVVGDSATATSKAPFRVLRGDSIAPSVGITSPSVDTTVPNDVESFVLKADISDNQGLALVRIGDRSISSAPWMDTVRLSVGRNVFVVYARDSAGNSSIDSVVVERAKPVVPPDTIHPGTDSIAPSVRITSPSGDTTVPNGVESFVLKADISDNKGLALVRIGDRSISSAPWIDTVRLSVGRNVLVVFAKDSAGNTASDTVVVERAKVDVPQDTIRPSISAPPDRTVGAQDSTLGLVWKISNVRKVAKVTLNNAEVAVDSQVARTVDLKPGANTFVLAVVDSAGRVVTATVVITRNTVLVRPIIEALPDLQVGMDDSTTTLEWFVVNSGKAISASVNGASATLGENVKVSVALKDSANRFVLTLRDSLGNGVHDTVWVFRSIDATAPTITWISPLSHKTVDPTVKSFTVQVRVTDRSGVDSVLIQGSRASKDADNIWSRTIALSSADGNAVPVIVSARDLRGNTARDSITITRAKDTIPPVVTILSPAMNAILSYEVTSLTMNVKAIDSGSGVKSITVGGKAVSANGAVDVTLVVGENHFVAIATDSAGNKDSSSVSVVRMDIAPAPVFSLAPARYIGSQTVVIISVAGSTIRYTLDGTTPNAASPMIASGGSVILGQNGPVVLKAMAVKAGFSQSNVTMVKYDIVIDVKPPAVAFLVPHFDTIIEYGTPSLELFVRATDSGSGIKSFTVDGKAVPSTGFVDVALLPGKNTFVASATDSAGNSAFDTVNVTVRSDTSKPVITRTASSSNVVVGMSSPIAMVSWKVTDNHIGEVTINNALVTATGGGTTYSKSVDITSDSQWIYVKASDHSGNVAYDSVLARLVQSPTLTAGGSFVTSKNVSISAPVGSLIEYQIDSGAWYAYTQPFILTSSATVKARASLGTIVETSDSVRYNINHDASLKSLVVGGITRTISGTTISVNTPLFDETISVAVLPSDSTAVVTINGMALKSMTVALVNSLTTVIIVVTNVEATKTYTLNLNAPASGGVIDSRDLRAYPVKKIDGTWWMMDDLDFAGTTQDTIGQCPENDCDANGRQYIWNEALRGQAAGLAGAPLCPEDWRVPSVAEWSVIADPITTLSIAERLGSAVFWTSDTVTSDATSAKQWVIRGTNKSESVSAKTDYARVRCIR